MRKLLPSTATALLLTIGVCTWGAQAHAAVAAPPMTAASAAVAAKPGEGFVGLSAPRARQDAASAVVSAESPPPLPTPEPRTLAMLLAGLAALGLAASRRRS